jgi:hypothetical protein
MLLITGLVTTQPGQQLYNGFRGDTCDTFLLPYPDTRHFIKDLNGHSMADTHMSTYQANGNTFGQYPEEAPGSRPNYAFGTSKGALYVTLFDQQCRDGVGCHEARIDDCATGPLHGSALQGRSVALNLAPDAVNIPISGIPGGTDPALEGVTVHVNTVHHPAVICQALATAAYHKTDPSRQCSVSGNIPIIR